MGPSALITRLTSEAAGARVTELGALLRDCVHARANIGFILPFDQAEAEAFWRDMVLPGLEAASRIMLVAEVDGRLAGTVQIDIATMPNQPHRAEVMKLMVHPDFRRRGVARQLMAAIESEARALGRTLLTLDTRTGDSAEPLYQSLGYQLTGTIPDFCLDPFEPSLHPTTVMYKLLK